MRTPQAQGRRVADGRITAARTAGIPLRVHQTYHNALNGFSAFVPRTDVGRLPSIAGVTAVYPVRRVYPAGVVEARSRRSARAPSRRRPRSRPPARASRSRCSTARSTRRTRSSPGTTLDSWNAVTDQPREDDPTPDAARHATYMAGIIAGSGGPAGLTGVAPGAKILPIQVMAMDRGVLVGTTSSLFAGIDRALDPNGDGNLSDHAEVIVAPVSEPFASFGDTPEAIAADGAAKAGALVVAAAGNDGPTGARFGTIATPASAASWLAVGSTDGRATLPAVSVQARRRRSARSCSTRCRSPACSRRSRTRRSTSPTSPGRPSPTPRAPPASRRAATIPATSWRPTAPAASPGKAVLIPRDGGAILPRIVNAAAAGAKAVLLYGDGPIANGALGLDDRVAIPVAVLPGYSGTLLDRAVEDGGDWSVTFGQSTAAANASRGAVAGFSSTGLGYGGVLKPDVVAPGVAITSSLAGGGYGAVTGTSASAAEVAGDAAVLLEAHPDMDGRRAARRPRGHRRPHRHADGHRPLARRRRGAGCARRRSGGRERDARHRLADQPELWPRRRRPVLGDAAADADERLDAAARGAPRLRARRRGGHRHHRRRDLRPARAHDRSRARARRST